MAPAPTPPQAFISSYAPRLRQYANSLLTPVLPQTAPTTLSGRTTKRGTVAKNYAEDEYDDDDIFEDSEGPRRQTGLRSRRDEPTTLASQIPPEKKYGQELDAPVDVQGIWRDWMGKLRIVRTDKQNAAQTNLPLTLIPIRIDLDVPSFVPQPALPLPPGAHDLGINSALPAYRTPEPTPPFRLKDIFLWNLHETLITPDQFATILIHDLDLPHYAKLNVEISNQIRSQLEEYAGVALHPLFHPTGITNNKSDQSSKTNGTKSVSQPNGFRRDRVGISAQISQGSDSNNDSSNPLSNTVPTSTNSITATATPIPVVSTKPQPQATLSDAPNNELDPDDTYRCIVHLQINLEDKVYSDKFEWSLLHPVGTAERFASLTCADLGFAGEWVPVMAHAIYEAVLKLKKEACESGSHLSGGIGGEIFNFAAETEPGSGAGWRYDPENLCEEWEPRLEILSKEDMEKREGDRERQLRRLRRETARFSSTANVGFATPVDSSFTGRGGARDEYSSLGDETPMGRGERSKRKRRFRSLSPEGKGTGSDAGAGAGGKAGYGGGGVGVLSEWERQSWRCSHCKVWGTAVWGVRDGPKGPRSLCMNCGLVHERDKALPVAAKNLHINDTPLTR